jgi:hypothetical protein
MASWFKSKRWFLVTCFIYSAAMMAQPRIDLTEGSLFLAGGLMLNYEMKDFTNSSHSLGLTSEVGGGYFILDYLAVGFTVPVNVKFAQQSTGDIGAKIFSTYFFNLDSSVIPYLGGSVTPGYGLTERSFQLSAGLDAGVLLSLSESVALDLGIKPELYFKLFDSQHWHIKVPAGFVGVRAVF